jgi:hypothetical protein
MPARQGPAGLCAKAIGPRSLYISQISMTRAGFCLLVVVSPVPGADRSTPAHPPRSGKTGGGLADRAAVQALAPSSVPISDGLCRGGRQPPACGETTGRGDRRPQCLVVKFWGRADLGSPVIVQVYSPTKCLSDERNLFHE